MFAKSQYDVKRCSKRKKADGMHSKKPDTKYDCQERYCKCIICGLHDGYLTI